MNSYINFLRTCIPAAETSHYDLINRNGDLLCHGVKCRRHKMLREGFGGLFCDKCLRKINAISEKILHDVSTVEKLRAEIEARREYALFRKIMDPFYMNYLLELEKRLSKLTSQQKGC